MEEDFVSRIMQSGTAESSGSGSPYQTDNSLPSIGHVMKEASISLQRGWSQSRKLTTCLLDLVTEKCKITSLDVFNL
jgi:hypothetical protein